MKKALLILSFLFVVFCVINPSLFAQETENKADESAKSEIKITIKDNPQKDIQKDSDKYYDESEIKNGEDAILLRELLSEVRRLREEIRILQDEIAYLRKIIEQSPMPERPLIRKGEGQPPRKLEPKPQPERLLEHDKQPSKEPTWKIEVDIGAEIKRLEDEISKNPKSIDARMMLADLYRQIGKNDSAIEQYKAVTELAPDFEPAHKAIEEMGAKDNEADNEH